MLPHQIRLFHRGQSVWATVFAIDDSIRKQQTSKQMTEVMNDGELVNEWLNEGQEYHTDPSIGDYPCV